MRLPSLDIHIKLNGQGPFSLTLIPPRAGVERMPDTNVDPPELYQYFVSNAVDETVEKVMSRLRDGGLQAVPSALKVNYRLYLSLILFF